MPGTDHAGISTQLRVEKQLAEEGRNREDISDDELLGRCWDWTEKHAGKIQNQIRKV